MIRVIIADDQVLLRESIGFILNHDEDIEVVGMTGDGNEVITMCARLSPDIILMDIEMPGMNGVQATKLIKEKYHNIKVIILTTFENTDNIMEAFINLADGYIVKNIKHTEIVLTIKCVAGGLSVIDDSVKKIMVKKFKGLMDYRSCYDDLLNENEIDIIRLIGEGKSNKDIALCLNYSEGTIKNSVSKILKKLELSDRLQIAIFAMENGIV